MTNEIRNYVKGVKVLYTEDKNIKDHLIGNKHRRLKGWKGCQLFNRYFRNHRDYALLGKAFAWDIFFPTFKLKQVKRLLKRFTP